MPEFLDITPTPDGLRRMVAMFTESIVARERLPARIEALNEALDAGEALNTEQRDLVEAGLNLLVLENERAIDGLRDAVAECYRALSTLNLDNDAR